MPDAQVDTLINDMIGHTWIGEDEYCIGFRRDGS
jgi:hypothetical protein